jgi:hypothetical protein
LHPWIKSDLINNPRSFYYADSPIDGSIGTYGEWSPYRAGGIEFDGLETQILTVDTGFAFNWHATITLNGNWQASGYSNGVTENLNGSVAIAPSNDGATKSFLVDWSITSKFTINAGYGEGPAYPSRIVLANIEDIGVTANGYQHFTSSSALTVGLLTTSYGRSMFTLGGGNNPFGKLALSAAVFFGPALPINPTVGTIEVYNAHINVVGVL